MNPEIFRMYDIRGIADRDLTDEVVEKIGKAYGTMLRRERRTDCAVGMDVRHSSSRIKQALIHGITSTGIDVLDIGMVPTPVLYFSVFHYNLGGGIEVTGSHNPVEYNGLKLMKGTKTIYGDEIQKLREMIEKEDFEKGTGSVRELNPVPDYIEKVLSIVYPGRKLKVVLDPGNGTAGPIAKRIFEKLGAEVVCINCEPDGDFPAHLPDPTIPEYMQQLIERVKEERADFGVGYDGDADRIGAVDEHGNIVWGDKLLGVFSKYVLERFPGSHIIFDVKCSQGIEEYISSLGGKPVMWKTGHSLIKAKMRELSSPLAGEMSGHMFCGGDYYGYDDAIFASARLYDILSNSEKTLSELVAEIPYYHATPEIRIETTEEDKWRIVEEIKELFRKKYRTIEIDGVRILFGDGWGLVRPSNTQPVIVARFEARTPERLEEIKKEVLDEIYKRGGKTYTV